MKIRTEKGYCLRYGNISLKSDCEIVKTFNSLHYFISVEPFARLKYVNIKTKPLLTLGYHHPSDDLVSKHLVFTFKIF